MKPTILLALALPWALQAAKGDRAVATVNGRPIALEEFDKAYKESLLVVGTRNVTRRRVLDDLINRELGLARARGGRLDRDPVVRRKMDDVLYHAQISKDLEPALKRIKVTDREVRDYYARRPEYRTAQILFRLRATPSKAEAEEAIKRALQVYDALKESPDKFSELANKHSQSAAAAAGGDVGFQPAVRYAEPYFKAINGKPDGHITPPVRTQFGYHIVKVLGRRDYGDVNKEFYKKVVYDEKRDAAMAAYFKGLRRSASISVNEGLLSAE